MLLVLVFNTIIFIVVIVVLVRHTIRRSKRDHKRIDVIQMMGNVISIVLLFGLTWIFGTFTILKADQAFQLTFTVTNSFQGFLIFIMFCVLNGDIRLAWAKLFLCKRLASLVTVPTKHSTSSRGIRSGIIKSAQSESAAFTEYKEVKTLGPFAQLSRTYYKNHMNEVVVLKFDEEKDTTPSSAEEIKAISPSSHSSRHMNIELAGEYIENFYTENEQSESEL